MIGKLILIAIIAFVVGTFVMYWLGLEPGVTIWNPLVYFVMHLDLSGVTGTQWLGFGGIFTAVSTAFGGVYKWIKTRSELFMEKKRGAEAAINSNTQINQLAEINEQKDVALTAVTTEKDSLQAKVTDYEAQFGNYKNVIDGKDAEIERLRSQIDGLSKQNVDKLAEDVSTKLAEKTRIS
jgi:hypothetical protein